MTDIPTTARITQYEVCAYPDPNDEDADLFTVTVDLRGKDRWMVKRWRSKECFDRDLNRTGDTRALREEDDYETRWQFATSEEAMEVARRAAASLTHWGMDAVEFHAFRRRFTMTLAEWLEFKKTPEYDAWRKNPPDEQ